MLDYLVNLGREHAGLSEGGAILAARACGIVLVLVLSWLANLLAKKLILRFVDSIVAKSRFSWLKLLQEKKVFARFSHVAPAIVIYYVTPHAVDGWDALIHVARVATRVYLIIVILMVLDATLNAFVAGYDRFSKGTLPIKGFVQAIKLILFLVGGVLIIATLMRQDLLVLVSGLGALTAVLMLIFRDPILGLVAGVQLSANDMVNRGDWIEMPQQGADGNVIDVSLTTVKVQNWDRTITNIPSYTLISDSFRNWRGMQESGGRRMKRSLYLDLRSLHFVDRDLLERLNNIRLLKSYLDEKLAEIESHNRDRNIAEDDLINGRRLTNIGCFRAYCAAYLRSHPQVHQEMTQMARQLDPTPNGLPIEIYAFAKDTSWIPYEGLQSDIFDHLFSVLPYFDLRVFQQPSGIDVENLGRSLK